jgi:hypothetical protein
MQSLVLVRRELHGSQRHTFDGSLEVHTPGGFAAFLAPGAGFNVLAALYLPTPEL